MKKLLILLLIVILIVVVIWTQKELIYKGKLFPSVRILFTTLFPPSNYYSLLFSQNIDVGKGKDVISIKYSNIYPGMYTIGFICSNWAPFDPDKNLTPGCIVNVKIVNQTNTVLLDTTVNKFNYWYWGKYGSGLDLLHYNVPKDIPLDSILECKLTIIMPDTQFANKHGPLSICATKDAEK